MVRFNRLGINKFNEQISGYYVAVGRNLEGPRN